MLWVGHRCRVCGALLGRRQIQFEVVAGRVVLILVDAQIFFSRLQGTVAEAELDLIELGAPRRRQNAPIAASSLSMLITSSARTNLRCGRETAQAADGACQYSSYRHACPVSSMRKFAGVSPIATSAETRPWRSTPFISNLTF